jgi:DNA gyrase/topoisomerase IV subunit A
VFIVRRYCSKTAEIPPKKKRFSNATILSVELLAEFPISLAKGLTAENPELVPITDGHRVVRSMGRPAYGVKGIILRKNDYVVGLGVTPNEEYRKNRQKELQKEGKDITPASSSPSPRTDSVSAPTSTSTASRPAEAQVSST